MNAFKRTLVGLAVAAALGSGVGRRLELRSCHHRSSAESAPPSVGPPLIAVLLCLGARELAPAAVANLWYLAPGESALSSIGEVRYPRRQAPFGPEPHSFSDARPTGIYAGCRA